jgi:hypothetical protein
MRGGDASAMVDRFMTRLAAPLSRRARALVVAVCAVVGAGAVYGGLALLIDAEGLGAKQQWLDGSPFPDYRVPGLVLLVLVGGGMLVTAVAALVHSRRTRALALVMAIVLLVWGVVETATIGWQGGPQAALLAIFVVSPAIVLAALALSEA